MLRTGVAIGLIGMVAACGDPLSGVDKITDVELSQTDPTAAALPSDSEAAREGFFGTDAAKAEAGTEGALPVDAAVPAEPRKRRGLLGLLRPAPSGLEVAAIDASAVPAPTDTLAQSARPATLPVDPAASDAVPENVAVATDVPAPEAAASAPQKRRGLLGLLRRPPAAAEAVAAPESPIAAPQTASAEAQSAQADPNTDKAAIDGALKTASLEAAPEAKPARRGLFSRAAPQKADAPRTGPDAKDVPYGTTLAYGLVARVCEAKGKNLGRRVEKAPARGFALYDSSPGAAGARTWYLTGFADGCPRQLTAANVLLGSATLYEQLHYGPTGAHLPVGATDKAYEGVKRKICGTRKGKPCGAKLSKMQNSTFFVSAYDSFGNSRRWSELLVHDGQVLASAVKTNN